MDTDFDPCVSLHVQIGDLDQTLLALLDSGFSGGLFIDRRIAEAAGARDFRRPREYPSAANDELVPGVNTVLTVGGPLIGAEAETLVFCPDAGTKRVRFVVCVERGRDCGSLVVGKLYQWLRDDDASRHSYIRVIDDSGEDYMYPQALFAPVEVPLGLGRLLVKRLDEEVER